MIELKCETCGKVIKRHPSQVREHNFCSKACAKPFLSKRFSEMNRNDNPLNRPGGWTAEQRERASARERTRKGQCHQQTYEKHCGRHRHREVAERMLGRPLKAGEVVHHIDGDKHNNSPENLMVLHSQSEHAKWHSEHRKEVME